MRLLFPVALLLTPAASPALAWPGPASEKKVVPVKKSDPVAKAGECRDASKQFARKGGVWQYDPLKPQKLAELPPADSYAAVYRLDERGCMVPVKYRDVRR